MARKIGVTITYVKVSWQEYEDRLNTLISAGDRLILPLHLSMQLPLCAAPG